MSIAQCAAAAVLVFPASAVSTTAGSLALPVVMVAIAGSESVGWHDQAAGDAGLDPQYGLCGGYSSWGLWQIHNVHATYLEGVTGSTDPCAWAAWLYDPVHCAQAALAVYQGQGLGAWSSYTDGGWQTNIGAAQQAVASALSAVGSGAGGVVGVPTVAPAIPLAAGIALVVGGVVAVELGAVEAVRSWRRLRQERKAVRP